MAHITEHSWSFFTYLEVLDNPSHRMDQLVPFFTAMMLQCKIIVYTDKEIWNSNDVEAEDIQLALVNGNFLPTKVIYYYGYPFMSQTGCSIPAEKMKV